MQQPMERLTAEAIFKKVQAETLPPNTILFEYAQVTGNFFYDDAGDPSLNEEGMSGSFEVVFFTLVIPIGKLINTESPLTNSQKLRLMSNSIYEG